MNRNVEIIAIDHGWSHIKTRSTVFVSGVEENVSPTFFDNVLEYNGKFYNIGGKRIEVKNTKVDNNDFYLLTLAAIAKELKNRNLTDANVYLAVGLPLTRFGEEKQAYSPVINTGTAIPCQGYVSVSPFLCFTLTVCPVSP